MSKGLRMEKKVRFAVMAGTFLCFCSTALIPRIVVAEERSSLVIQAAHTGRIKVISASPDGKYLATGSDDNTIKIRDFSSGRIVHSLNHGGDLISAVFSKDSAYLVSCGHNKRINLWEISTGKLIRTIFAEKHSAVIDVAVSPDFSALASVGRYSNEIDLWDVATGRLIRSLSGHEDAIHSVVFTPDGKNLVSGGKDGSLRIWETASGRQQAVLEGHKGKVITVAVTPDGKYVLSGGGAGGDDDTAINIWSLEDKKLVDSINVPKMWKMDLSSDGKYVTASDRDSRIKCWALSTRKILHTIKTGSIADEVLVFNSENGLRILYNSWNDVVVWDAGTGQTVNTISGNIHATVRVTALSPDGKYLASGSRGDTCVSVWDVTSGKLHRVFDDSVKGGIVSLLFSRDGKYLAQGSAAGTINLWDFEKGKIARTLKWGTKDEATALAITETAESEYLISWHSGASLRFWDMKKGKLINALVAGSNNLFDLAGGKRSTSSPMIAVKDHYLVLGHSDGSIRVIDVLMSHFNDNRMQSSMLRESHKGKVTALAASQDGKLLISGSEDNTVKVFGLADGVIVATLTGHKHNITAIAVTPDNKHIISGDEDGYINIWELQSGTLIRSLKGHSWSVRSLAITPDSKRLISGGGNESIVFWELATGENLATILAFGKDGHIIYTPDGYFDYSPGAAAYATQCLSYVAGNKSYGLEKETTYHKQEVITERLNRP